MYYARYFDWFTEGRIAFLREQNLSYMDTFHRNGIVAVAIHAHCDYHRALAPEETIAIETALTGLTPTRMTFGYHLYKAPGDTLAAEGETQHAFVDADGRPFNLKKRFPELWERLAYLVRK